jgi:hypothetical protein
VADTNKLCSIDALALSDSIRVWDDSNANERRATLSALTDFLNSNLSVAGITTQYAAPASAGFSLTMEKSWLLLTPTGALASGTIAMPASPIDRQTVEVSSTQTVTSMAVTGNGKGITGQPSTIAANGFFRMRYDAVMQSWYRIG